MIIIQDKECHRKVRTENMINGEETNKFFWKKVENNVQLSNAATIWIKPCRWRKSISGAGESTCNSLEDEEAQRSICLLQSGEDK